MNRVDGMEALDAVENGMIKLGQSRRRRATWCG